MPPEQVLTSLVWKLNRSKNEKVEPTTIRLLNSAQTKDDRLNNNNPSVENEEDQVFKCLKVAYAKFPKKILLFAFAIDPKRYTT